MQQYKQNCVLLMLRISNPAWFQGKMVSRLLRPLCNVRRLLWSRRSLVSCQSPTYIPLAWNPQITQLSHSSHLSSWFCPLIYYSNHLLDVPVAVVEFTLSCKVGLTHICAVRGFFCGGTQVLRRIKSEANEEIKLTRMKANSMTISGCLFPLPLHRNYYRERKHCPSL